jgi:serine/threonine-protein kinase
MSPEQARGAKEVDARADVYGLGASLYEALTGELPFRGQAHLVLLQVLEEEPRPPRKLNDRVPRDLETICLKALAKEPGRRYQGAAEMRDDLRRWLAGEPIRARPAGALERGWRWCRRNPVVAGLLSALVVVLAGGLIGVTAFWRMAVHERGLAEAEGREAVGQAARAEEEKEKATQHAARAEAEKARARKNLERALQAIDQMLNRLGDEGLAYVPQFGPERRRILSDALALYKGLLEENSSEPRARFETGRAYWRMGDIHRLLGQKKEARADYERAAALLEGLNKASPDDPEYQAALATCYRDLGRLVDRTSRASLRQAQEQAERSRALWQRLAEREPHSLEHRFWLADVHYWLAGLNDWQGRPKEAEAHFLQTVKLQNKLLASPSATTKQKRIASVYCSMGAFYMRLGEWAKAEQALRDGLRRFEKLAPESPREIKFQSEWAFASTRLGRLAARKRDWAAAEALYRAALPPLAGLVRDHPTVLNFVRDYWECHTALALALEAQGRYDDALAEHRRAKGLEDKARGLPRRSEQLLRACARRAELERNLSAYLSGDAKPAGVADLLDLARLCQARQQRYAAAARFYEQAFRASPKLAGNVLAGHRYNAACAAALGGCGQGKDDPAPDEAARARLRRQALDWLRAERAAWEGAVKSGPPQARQAARQALRHWQEDADLAGLRGASALEKLPGPEREAWQKLWADVRALSDRVGAEGP